MKRLHASSTLREDSVVKPPDLVLQRESRCAPEPTASPRSLARALM